MSWGMALEQAKHRVYDSTLNELHDRGIWAVGMRKFFFSLFFFDLIPALAAAMVCTGWPGWMPDMAESDVG